MNQVVNNLFFGNRDKVFWQNIIKERTNLFGADGFYLVVDILQNRDPYYNEPIGSKLSVIRVPIKLFIAVERIEEPAVIERGLQLETRITVFILTDDLARNKIMPKEGDIIEIWNKQFDVVDTEPMSIFGNRGITRLGEAPSLYWRFSLARRVEYIPERKVVERT